MQTHDPVRLCALADLVLLQCDLLRRPQQMLAALADLRESTSRMLRAAGLELDDPAAVSLTDAIALATAADPEEWSLEYHRLFEGATVCPLNQTAYVRRDKGAVIGDLCAFYRAFGFAPVAATGEKADHLVTELEFLAALLVMLAQAEGEPRQVTHDALLSYGREHLCDWIPSVSAYMAMVSGSPFYAAVAKSLDHVWGHICAELNLPAADNALSPKAEPVEPADCIVPAVGEAF